MHPINHHLRIAKILIVTFFVGYFGFLMIPKTNAQVQTNPKTRIATCENVAYGVKYSKTREANCRLLWEFFSYQTLPTDN